MHSVRTTWIPRAWHKHIPGILLEGGSFSGKSTLAAAIEERFLHQREFAPLSRHCYACEDEINAQLHAWALASFDQTRARYFRDAEYFFKFNLYKSANIRWDCHLLEQRQWSPNTVLIQDRHWFSQYCQNAYFTPDEAFLPLEWVHASAPQFKLHAYLTCSETTRLQRAALQRQSEQHGLHAHFQHYPEDLGQFEQFCLDQWPHCDGWIVIDMGRCSINSAADLICREFLHAAHASS